VVFLSPFMLAITVSKNKPNTKLLSIITKLFC
jgi:hypothetical protein